MARTRSRGGVLTLAAVVAVLAALWLWGLVGFVAAIPRPADEAGVAHTDAIVVLTGGRGRVEKGLALLAAGEADKLFISGVDRTVDMRTLVDSGAIPPDLSACCVALGHAARNTRENAHETARWMAKEGLSSLRLVTADFHMPRSLVEFEAAMPEARIVPAPVYSEKVHLEAWWRWPGTSGLLIGEYMKYLGTRVRQIASPGPHGFPE